MIDARGLRRDNAELRQKLAAVAAMAEENAALRAQITDLVATVAKLNDRIGELLAIAQRKQRKPSTPKPPGSPRVVPQAAQAAFEARPVAPARPPDEEPKKKRPPPTGRKPVPAHLEADEHTLRPDGRRALR